MKVGGRTRYKYIKLGRPTEVINCLAFADDLVILDENFDNAKKRLELLKETAEK